MDVERPNARIFRFDVFDLDTQSGELLRHGLKVRLPDQSFQILQALLSRRGEVVTRDELRRVLWTSETFVNFEVGLNSAVRKLREALDDSSENPRFVETLPRRGYRFIAPVTVAAPDSGTFHSDAADQTSSTVPGSVHEQLPVAIAEPGARAGSRYARIVWSTGLALLFTLVVAAGILWQRRELTSPRDTAIDSPIRSLVVLPFENLTRDEAHDPFVDNLTAMFTEHLARGSALRVVSRTSAQQYKATDKGVPEIGKDFHVDGVMRGTVGVFGQRVRISVKLIRAATERQVWAQDYDGDSSRIVSLQQRIASDVAGAAGRPAPGVARPRTPRSIDARAHKAYVLGLTARANQNALLAAVSYFEQAVAIEPEFAEAYALLALAQVQFLYGGPFSPHQTIPKAEAAARKALQLDESLGHAHWALGVILALYYWRWDEGAHALQRAAELQGDDELSLAVGESLIRAGRFTEAIAAAERATKLDPLSVNARVAVAMAYRAAGQHARAVEELRATLEVNPGHNRVRFQIGATLVALGRLDDGIRELTVAARFRDPHNSRMEALLGYAYAAAGDGHAAREILKELESHRREQYVSWFGIALIYDALGEKEPALSALQRAYEDRAVEFGQMAAYPAFKAIASEPRFQAVMRHVGLPR